MFLEKLNHKKILILILILTAFLRLYRLDYPHKFVFDEVYHAFTAQEYTKGLKDAWEWWTTPPPGVAYEWTHPPLAKEVMAASMLLTNSQDSWAWRLPGSLLGVLSVYLVFLIGKKLLNNEVASLIAAFTFSIDGLNFVQSRTGMNDIYFVTFMLFSFYLFLHKKFFLSSVMLGLSLASKWAAIYTFIIYIPLLIAQKRFKKLLYFLSIPVFVYLISYIPFFLVGHDFNQFIQLQQQMWWYHTGLKATHTYSSPAWSWPFNLFPVWYFVDYKDKLTANIFASGNPLIFWSGFACIIVTLWEIFKKKSLNLAILSLGFFAFWAPWFFSPRIMFLYHFSPSVPFLCLALGHQLSKGWEDKKTRQKIYLLLILFSISFALLFPYLTAVHLPNQIVQFFFMTNLTNNPF